MKRWPWVLVVVALALFVAIPVLFEPYQAEAAAPGLEVAGQLDLADEQNKQVLKDAIDQSMQLKMYRLIAQAISALLLIVGLVAGVGELVRQQRSKN